MAAKRSSKKAGKRGAKPAATKRSRGRPSGYRPEYAEQTRKMAALGLTDEEIADVLGRSVSTINKWKQDHPEFSEALKGGKDIPDNQVESSLYRRATGYEHKGKEVPPDVTACIFWLKNRRPNRWRQKDAPVNIGKLAKSLTAQGQQIIEAMAKGEIAPSDASSMLQAVAAQARIIEVDELEKRVRKLEELNAA